LPLLCCANEFALHACLLPSEQWPSRCPSSAHYPELFAPIMHLFRERLSIPAVEVAFSPSSFPIRKKWNGTVACFDATLEVVNEEML
jgi:hypothetical protein